MTESKTLTPFEKWVIEEKGTEQPFTGLYTQTTAEGTYRCKRCDHALYLSEDKFASHCGWPSFDAAISGAVAQQADADGQRVEILCQHCGAHLGHVFHGEGFTAKNVRHCVNSVALNFKARTEALKLKSVILASGCFWGTQYYLSRIQGVIESTVGYTGGHLAEPSYKAVCSGNTGHVEAISLLYDPTQVSLSEILKVYFETHNFSQKDGQGPDIGPQYLSVLFYADEEELALARALIDELKSMGHEVATALKPRSTFWPAEDYHQNYYERKGDTPYCHVYRQIFQRRG